MPAMFFWVVATLAVVGALEIVWVLYLLVPAGYSSEFRTKGGSGPA
jgi:hypothetical protein